jgi:subtilisin family serine protease
MPPFRHWAARLCASGPRGTAPSRLQRNHCALALETLEDRCVPTATVTNTTSWRNETFHIDDTVVSSGSTGSTTSSSSAPQNASFGKQIGLNQLLAADDSYTGTGYTVAVIDTGIDYNNTDLGGGWGKRVVGGYDFYNNDSDPMDDNGHGTNVAGIIGASDATYSGVAPNVDFVALKVLGADGSGTFGAVSNALDWVIANRVKYNIVAINMSLGSGNYTVDPYTFLESDMQTLVAQGVFIGVASGNDYYSYQAQGLAFPAVSPNVVSVGAVWDGNYGSVGWANGARDNTTAVDQITSFTQRGPNLSILAPGAMVTSVYLGNTFKAMAGTSMATPVIVGSAVVLREELDLTGHSNLDNQSSILSIMQSTGVAVVDNNAADVNVPVTGRTFKRIDLLAAVTYVESLSGGTGHVGGGNGGTSNSGPTLAAIGTQNVGLGGSVSVGLNASDAAGKTITLTANVLGYSAGNALAYTLKQSLGLSYAGSYYTNSWGKNEKWLEGSGGAYYAILPDGEFRKWTGTLDGMMSASNLIATLDPTVYADPSLLWNAAPAAAAPLTLTITGNQLTIAAGQTAGTYTVDVTASDGTQSVDQKFSVVVIGAANGTVDHGPVWTPIADKTMHQGTLTVPLTATDPDGDKLTFSASVSGATGVGLVVSGTNLAITPPTGYTGTFTVTVAASDGQISTSTTFHVTVGNSPPTLTVPTTVTAPTNSKTVSFGCTASDPDGDSLTTTATIQSSTAASSSLAQLKQSLNLSYAGSYFQNIRGLNEKWLISADRTTWYCLLPNGELCKYAATNAQMLSPTNVMAKLDPSVYADPSKLWNATPAVAAAATVKIANGQVTVTVAQGYHGTVTVLVTVSDGLTTVTKTVAVTF